MPLVNKIDAPLKALIYSNIYQHIMSGVIRKGVFLLHATIQKPIDEILGYLKPDLIILDIIMPLEDGYTAAKNTDESVYPA